MSNVIDTTGWSYTQDSYGNTTFNTDSYAPTITTGSLSVDRPLSNNERNVASQYYSPINYGSLFTDSINNANSGDNIGGVIDNLKDISDIERDYNNSVARDNAMLQYNLNLAMMREQHKLNQASARQVMDYNAREAQLNREFQERMANSAHQREIDDLKMAGLNPVLSAMNGNGAYTPNGAVAATNPTHVSGLNVSQPQTDMTNSASVIGTFLSGYLNRTNEIFLSNLGHEHNLTRDDVEHIFKEALQKSEHEFQIGKSLLQGGLTGAGFLIAKNFFKNKKGKNDGNGNSVDNGVDLDQLAIEKMRKKRAEREKLNRDFMTESYNPLNIDNSNFRFDSDFLWRFGGVAGIGLLASLIANGVGVPVPIF